MCRAVGAAQMVSQNGWMDSGAVASRRAAELYGLDILDEGIQDMKDNVTRFIVLSRSALAQLAYCASLVCLLSLVWSSCWATCSPLLAALVCLLSFVTGLVISLGDLHAPLFVPDARAVRCLLCTGMVISMLLATIDSALGHPMGIPWTVSRVHTSKFQNFKFEWQSFVQGPFGGDQGGG